MRDPKRYGAALTLAQEMLREPASLEPVEREVIAAFTSCLNGCHYCHTSHTEFAESLGSQPETVERLQPVLAYVEKLTCTPSQLTQEDFDAVLAGGFTEQQLSDAIGVCAAFNFYNRIVEGHGIQPKDGYADEVAIVNERGYDQRY
jgi:uncharacterized peroxidase-related enzyme